MAVVIYTLFPDNHIVLPIFGFLFSLPCFWIVIQHPAYQQAGRFILLTYVRIKLGLSASANPLPESHLPVRLQSTGDRPVSRRNRMETSDQCRGGSLVGDFYLELLVAVCSAYRVASRSQRVSLLRNTLEIH